MKIVGQDSDGRLIVDLEGEAFVLAKSIPGDKPVWICNGVFSHTVIPNGAINGSFSNNPLPGIQYQQLEIIDPRNPNVYIDTIEPEDIIEEDPIEDRFIILDIR